MFILRSRLNSGEKLINLTYGTYYVRTDIPLNNTGSDLFSYQVALFFSSFENYHFE